ncbi:TfoX/Sxy family protein [Pseudoteredinibacter isoporae]|uniref:DNA transformation protein n=1 Tax=Pseudoteredinibacter isoporae TaxID=570281 RepID=A0A7X0JVD6_9GAMM|nr:TfoX/Sxy family protein [Pseudoteredinibacter isoporae]MBB6522973.1 DNA transformation protein [Pseudoteredinibacter isoporae]NHO88497.1 TfoX/Sxy family protein [Pseudoteredinibacter isoporae]NIB22104.1 TfoX/Sxy family protein [Pseudoteredinibacter isoporae]
MSDRDSELLQLKNLGIATVNILNAIGVHSRNELQAMGPVQAYVRIKQRGIHVSKVMLYALQGALDDRHWNELSQEAKDQLVQEADNFCLEEDTPH